MSDDPIPYIPFDDIVINLTLPQYISLKNVGGYYELTGNDQGVRGIIIYRKSASVYLAYEKNCSFRPNEACATVDVDGSTLYMTDTCCGSSFSFSDGSPISGPAWRPLRQYLTFLNGFELTITDEIVD